jgi:hypothetical protein
LCRPNKIQFPRESQDMIIDQNLALFALLHSERKIGTLALTTSPAADIRMRISRYFLLIRKKNLSPLTYLVAWTCSIASTGDSRLIPSGSEASVQVASMPLSAAFIYMLHRAARDGSCSLVRSREKPLVVMDSECRGAGRDTKTVMTKKPPLPRHREADDATLAVSSLGDCRKLITSW